MALDDAEYFLTPVTTETAPDYEKVVKRPMDFGTVKVKLADDKYGTPKTFLSDCRLVFDNAKLYNKEDDLVYKSAVAFEDKFDSAWREVEKELERLAQERNTLIAKASSNPDTDPKAWLKQVGDQAAPAIADEAEPCSKQCARASTPPPPPPPNAHTGSPPPPPPPAPPQPQEQQQPYNTGDYEMEVEHGDEMAPVSGVAMVQRGGDMAPVSDVAMTHGQDAMVVEQMQVHQSMPNVFQQPDDAHASQMASVGSDLGAREVGVWPADAAEAEEGIQGVAAATSMAAQMNPIPGIDNETDPKAWLHGQPDLLSAAASPQKGLAQGGLDKQDLDALLPYTVATMQGPPLIFPPDWPEDGVHICAEDDRPLDVARKFRVNLERLVRMNRKT